jgi:hypothetical protein
VLLDKQYETYEGHEQLRSLQPTSEEVVTDIARRGDRTTTNTGPEATKYRPVCA